MPGPVAIVIPVLLGLVLEEIANSDESAEKIIESGLELVSSKNKKTIPKKGGKNGN